MQMKAAYSASSDGQVLQDLGLQRSAEPLGLPDPVVLGGGLELGERGDAQILVEPQRLVRTEPGHAQDLQHADRNFLPEFLKARMRAIPVKLGDDVGNGVSDARDLGEPVLLRSGHRGDARAPPSCPRRVSRPWPDRDCRRATRSAGHIPEATWLLAAYRPSASFPSGDNL